MERYKNILFDHHAKNLTKVDRRIQSDDHSSGPVMVDNKDVNKCMGPECKSKDYNIHDETPDVYIPNKVQDIDKDKVSIDNSTKKNMELEVLVNNERKEQEDIKMPS